MLRHDHLDKINNLESFRHLRLAMVTSEAIQLYPLPGIEEMASITGTLYGMID